MIFVAILALSNRKFLILLGYSSSELRTDKTSAEEAKERVATRAAPFGSRQLLD